MRFAPGAERHRLAPDELRRVDDEHVGVVEVLVERVPRALKEERVAGCEHVLAGPVLALRCTARTTRSPLSVTIPGKTVSPMRPERGGMTTSATPERGVRSASASSSISYWSTSVWAWSLKSGGIARRAPMGEESFAEENDDRDRADEERHADERELEEAEPADPGVLGRLGDDHVDGVPVSASSEPACAAEGERHQELGRRPPEPHGHHDDDRAAARRPRR